jgi:hypothetical protein
MVGRDRCAVGGARTRRVLTPVHTSFGHYGVVRRVCPGEAIELFANPREAERVVQNWDDDEPERAGELHVEAIELETSPAALVPLEY